VGTGTTVASTTPVHIERVHSAYRLAFILALVYALWLIWPTVGPHVRAYFEVVATNARRPDTPATEAGKLSAAKVEAILAPNFANAQLRCRPAERNWDYVCTYLTPQLRTKMQFGVTVDAATLLQISRAVPEGTSLPSPK
jgi:hypothetical protein